jgi:toxin ParE1/3/4
MLQQPTDLLASCSICSSLLSRNSEIGQQRPDLKPDLRSISHGNYVVLFYPAKGGAEIVGVVHGARDIDNLFKEERQ